MECGESFLNFLLFCDLFPIETQEYANTVQCGVVLSDLLVVTKAEPDPFFLCMRLDGVLKAPEMLLQYVP